MPIVMKYPRGPKGTITALTVDRIEIKYTSLSYRIGPKTRGLDLANVEWVVIEEVE